MMDELFSKEGNFMKLGEFDNVASKLAYALGDEILLEFKNFNDLTTEYSNIFFESESISYLLRRDESEMLIDEITRKAGKLHNMLREKLISIRDE